MKITKNNFNYDHMKYYYNFRWLRYDGIVNPRPTVTTTYKRNSPVENLNIPIKCKPILLRLDMLIPLCNDTKLITSVTTENKFIICIHVIMINKYHDRKKGLETSKIYPSYEPNPMDFHRNTLIFCDEGRSNYSKLGNTKKVVLVTP